MCDNYNSLKFFASSDSNNYQACKYEEQTDTDDYKIGNRNDAGWCTMTIIEIINLFLHVPSTYLEAHKPYTNVIFSLLLGNINFSEFNNLVRKVLTHDSDFLYTLATEVTTYEIDESQFGNLQSTYSNYSGTVKLENQIDCPANINLSSITPQNYNPHFTKYVGQMKDSQDEDAYELDSFQLNYNRFNDSHIKKSLEQETQTLKQTMDRYIKHALLYWIVRYWLESPLIWQDQDVQDFVFIELKKQHIFNYGNDINLKVFNVIHYPSRQLLGHWHKILSELIFSEGEDFSFDESHARNKAFSFIIFYNNLSKMLFTKNIKKFYSLHSQDFTEFVEFSLGGSSTQKNHQFYNLYDSIHILV